MQQLCYFRFHFIVALSIVFGCPVPQASSTLALMPEDGIRAAVSLSGHLSTFDDPTGRLTINDVVSGHSDIQFEPIANELAPHNVNRAHPWAKTKLEHVDDAHGAG